jgi:hypothetical protein
MPALSSKRTESAHGAATGKTENAASKPRKDEESEMSQAIVEDADKTRAKTAISFTATAGRWVSGDPRI